MHALREAQIPPERAARVVGRHHERQLVLVVLPDVVADLQANDNII